MGILIGAAPASGFPLYSVYSDLITAAGGTPIAENNTRYWDKPTYPSVADTTYTSIATLNTDLQSADADNKTFFIQDATSGADITIPAARTGVTICPETRDGVDMAGYSIDVYGSFCNIYGFIWDGGDQGNGLIDIRGPDNVVAYCTVDGNGAAQWFQGNEPASGSGRGHRMRFCYCTFQNKTTNSACINITKPLTGTEDEIPLYSRTDHCAFINCPGKTADGTPLSANELYQIGAHDANFNYWGMLDNCYFYRHDNDGAGNKTNVTVNKTIKVASGGNQIIQNVFLECCNKGATIRSGNYNSVYANWVIGNDAESSGGTRIMGEDCLIACNYYKSLNPSSTSNLDYAAIIFEDGGDPPPASGNQNAHRAEVSFNTIYDQGYRSLDWRGGNDTKMYNNAVEHSDSPAIVGTAWGNNPTFGGNVIEANVDSAALTLGGITEATPALSLNNGYYVPTTSGNCDGASGEGVNGYSSLITVDILGNPIPASNPNVGCFQPGYDLTTDPVQAIIDNAGAAA